ncbi:serine hydroxymethyltransferase [Bradyrhizobium sp. JYMT SZCCT0428]|uniref:serine hydroxymethyltransferase n=1 Tax=Bradyrhizobium sp. JYMT SZCCT0428 TaxID=2807673 RepID=UPI001BAC20C9|nr:serine hydroxymethyltransferase [Bradyrhizobium sp. JYMT SZCCT0428]MBR1154075.1 serine hydroxymethyltransferase [Bradyrhizobium sp. JYMT SZCCT0428]
MNVHEPTTSVSSDAAVFDAIGRELARQQNQIELIASENIVSEAVLAAQGSVLTNKYAEGYPGRRYYGGCEFVDEVETLAISRAKNLFGCQFANVQAHSGAQANLAAFLALLNPGDTFLGMALAHGGHLTHGSPVTISGKWFSPVEYCVRDDNHLIDMDNVRELALKHRPKLILAGGSAYPRQIDFASFRQIADEIGAKLMVDMAHVAGLVAGGAYPSPVPHAHVVTSTTHKTLRGPRGGLIVTNDADLAKKINSAVFPGVQGGPLMHVIAGKAVAFGEALEPSFKIYARQMLENARAMAAVLAEGGLSIVSGGTDSHLALVDLRPLGITGKAAETALEQVGLTCNKNAIPFDPQKPALTSGIRLGSSVGTSRGFGEQEFRTVGSLILRRLTELAKGDPEKVRVERIAKEVRDLCDAHPIYSSLRA